MVYVVRNLSRLSQPVCNLDEKTLVSLCRYGLRPCPKYSLTDLVKLRHDSPDQRAQLLHEVLKVGCAKSVLSIRSMPFDFGAKPSLRKVERQYYTDFNELIEFERQRPVCADDSWTALLETIFKRHRGTMIDMATGVFELRESLEADFGHGVSLTELREHLPQVLQIEKDLDDFLTNRITLRLLIQHVLHLNKKDSKKDGKVGAVNEQCCPINLLTSAYQAARYMCQRDYGCTSDLLVNSQPFNEYVMDTSLRKKFAYVDNHLFYMFFEILKNAMRTSIDRMETQDLEFPPPIEVTVADMTSLWDEEQTVKIADTGEGMRRQQVHRASSYFYSSAKKRPASSQNVADFDSRAPLAGFGFGLPISRVLARYFDGDLHIDSIVGKGTDVFLYL